MPSMSFRKSGEMSFMLSGPIRPALALDADSENSGREVLKILLAGGDGGLRWIAKSLCPSGAL